MALLAFIDSGELLTVVWTAALAGVGVTTAYGLAILGFDRAVEFGRAGRPLGATAYGLLGLVGAAAVVAALVFGIFVMIDK